VAVVDVNNDSKPDIIVANEYANNVGVLFNSGNGTFTAQTTYSTGTGSSPWAVAVVDVNSDNKPDIIVANSGVDNVGVLFNSGNGTFTAQTTYSTGTDSAPTFVAVVDVNSDSKPDIIVANYLADNVGVLFNSGNGTFTAQTTYSTGNGSSPNGVAVVDVNSDNKPDIIVANKGSVNVGVFLNSGNGTFTAQTTYSTGTNSYPTFVAVVDVNNDSKPDIIVANEYANNVGVLFNSGNGTFTAQTTYSTGTSSLPYAVAVVDVNSDSKPDIIVANYGASNVGVLLNC
jgi:mannose-1-phosphate guanylyltransferase